MMNSKPASASPSRPKLRRVLNRLSSSNVLRYKKSDTTPASSQTSVTYDPSNRLSDAFAMITLGDVRDIGPPSPLYIPPYRRVALPREKKRLLPRLWNVVALSPRKRMTDRNSVDHGFPLDGEEGELIEDEGFLDVVLALPPTFTPGAFDIVALLPPELSLHIFSFLDLQGVTATSLVSHYWNVLAADMYTWRSLFYRHSRWHINAIRAAVRTRLSSRASRISTITLYSRWGKVTSSPTSARSSIGTDVTSPPLTLALDWYGLYKTRLELDRRWASAEPKITKLAGHNDSVYCVEFDHTKIITGSRDKTIKIWSTSSGKLLTTLRGHEGSVLCLKFESKSGFMVSGSSDRQVLVWDLGALRTEGNVRPKAALRGHAGGVLDLRLSPDFIVSCSKDSIIRVWSRVTLELVCSFEGHTGPVNAIDLSPCATRVISASGDGTLMLWDVPSRSLVRTFSGHSRGLACVAFVASSQPSFINKTTSKSNDPTASSTPKAEIEDGSLVVSGSNDKTIRVWRACTGECVALLEGGHSSLVRALAYDARAGRLVSSSYDRSVVVWQLELDFVDDGAVTGKPEKDESSGKQVVKWKKLRTFKGHHSSHIFDVKFDAGRIISTSHDRKIVVLDFGTDLDISAFD